MGGALVPASGPWIMTTEKNGYVVLLVFHQRQTQYVHSFQTLIQKRRHLLVLSVASLVSMTKERKHHYPD